MEKETKKIFIGGNMLTGAIDAIMSNGHQCAITLNENGGYTIEYSDKNIRYLNNQIHNLNNEIRRLEDKILQDVKKASRENNGWISVKDELPEYGEKVLVTNADVIPLDEFFSERSENQREILDKNNFVTFYNSERKPYEITHFMRIKKVNEV